MSTGGAQFQLVVVNKAPAAALPLSLLLPHASIGQIPVSGSRRPIVVGKASEVVGHSLSWCIAVQSALKPENKGQPLAWQNWADWMERSHPQMGVGPEGEQS